MSDCKIAELLGVTKQRAHQIAEEKGFPAPATEDGRGRLWDRREVTAWAVDLKPADGGADVQGRMRWSERIAAVFMLVGLSGLTACDPGYQFTIHNLCDAPMTVDLRDSDEFGRSGTGGAVTIAPHSTASWSQIDPDINPPFGVSVSTLMPGMTPASSRSASQIDSARGRALSI